MKLLFKFIVTALIICLFFLVNWLCTGNQEFTEVIVNSKVFKITEWY